MIANMSTADNIKAMLDSVRADRQSLKARDDTLKQREATLLEWLKEEQPVQADLGIAGGQSNLSVFLYATLQGGKKFTAGQLGALASDRGLIEGDAVPGRVVHGALLSLQRNGQAKRHDDGTWSK